MAVFELVIALLFGGAVLSAWARRLSVPYPALLALAGAALALLPSAPTVTLDPELALTLFVAPVLLDAAFDASTRDLKDNWRAVTSLAILAVGLTVVAAAVVARWLVPDLPWAAAIALGAIVAPPDAAAATAVLRQLRPPHRILVILEGESLFNDASSLLIYRLAVGVAVTGSFSGWAAIPTLLLVCAGSLALGLVLSWLQMKVFPLVEDASTSIIFQFLTTFAVWILAEAVHLSGILTVVVFAISVARSAPQRMPARLRVPSYAVWDVAVFVLNVLAFILIGLQLKPILQRLGGAQLADYVLAAAAICGAVIVVRIVWVLIYAATGRWKGGRRAPSLRGAVVVAWCGMRGIVTLAAALALPERGFPHRDFVVFAAFAVVLCTLVVQGMTLAPLIRLLGLKDDGAVDREVRLARAATARAALDAVDGDPTETMAYLRRKYQARLRRAESDSDEADDALAEIDGAIRRVQAAERRTLTDLRAQGVIGDDAFHRVEEELDMAELNAETMARSN